MDIQEKTNQTPVKKRRLHPIDNLLVLYLNSFLILVAGQVIGELLLYQTPQADYLVTAKFYASFTGIWISFLLVMYLIKHNRPILKTLGTGMNGNTAKNFLLGLAVGFGLNMLCALGAMLHGDIKLTFDAIRPAPLALVLVCVFIQSSAEELMCRGFLYQRLLRRYRKPAVAIVGNICLFCLLHVGNPGVTALGLMSVLLSGLLFSMMVYYMDSLWAAMAAHTAWNFTQNILLGLPNSGNVMPFSVFKLDAASAMDSFAYNVGFGLEGTVLAAVLLLAASAAVMVWGMKKEKQPTDIWTVSGSGNTN